MKEDMWSRMQRVDSHSFHCGLWVSWSVSGCVRNGKSEDTLLSVLGGHAESKGLRKALLLG